MTSEDVPSGNWAEEKPIEAVSLQAFEELCRKTTEQDKVVDKLKAELKLEQEKADDLYAEIQKILAAHNKDNYKSAVGTFYRYSRWNWKIPSSLEAKTKFFDFLKQKGIFLELVSVNSNTLNSFCKAEYEAAKEAGNVDFKVPGLEAPTAMEKIGFRKSK